MAIPTTTRRRILAGLTVLAGLAALCLGVFLADSSGWFRDREAEGRTREMLTKPLRLEAPGDRMFDEFLEGVGTFNYRASAVGEATFRDRFFDTADGRLAALGCAYRFRERRSGRDGSRWSVRLERRLEPGESKRLDVRSVLPDTLGRAIAGGEWALALTGGGGLPAPDRLRALLAEQGIDVAELAVRLVGDLERTRHELTDRGRVWFELDHESWTFRAPGGTETASFTDVVIDTRLKKGDPEIERRVNTMDMLVRTMYAFEATNRSPVERARTRLGLE